MGEVLLENFMGCVTTSEKEKKDRAAQAAGHRVLKAPPNGGKRAFAISTGFVSREGSCLQFGPLWYVFISPYEDWCCKKSCLLLALMCAASGMEGFRLVKVWYFTYIGTVAFGRKYELPTWPSRSPCSITLCSGQRPSAPSLNAKEQAPNHSGRCWAKPLWPAAFWVTCAQV